MNMDYSLEHICNKNDSDTSLFEKVNTFLYFGYLPGAVQNGWEMPIDQPLVESGVDEFGDKSFGQLVEIGAELFLSLFDRPDVKNAENIVLLSGGLDSRMLLGGLIRKVGKGNVRTASIGVPGMLDVTFARQVSEATDVPHHLIDSRDQDFSIERMEKEAQRSTSWFNLIGNSINLIHSRFGEDKIYWDGVLGGTLTRGTGRGEQADAKEARRKFIEKAQSTKTLLSHSFFDPDQSVPQTLPISPALVSPLDQLRLGIKYPYQLIPSHLPTQYRCEAPYTHPAWLRFILGVPGSMRQNQCLFQAIGRRLFPDLMALPVKRSYGLPIGAPMWQKKLASARLKIPLGFKRMLGRYPGPPPTANQMDWAHEIRYHTDLNTLIGNLIKSLQLRGTVPWIAIDRYWRAHQTGRRDYSREMMLLSSLELFLRSEPITDDAPDHQASNSSTKMQRALHAETRQSDLA